jgi:hypothetical protein
MLSTVVAGTAESVTAVVATATPTTPLAKGGPKATAYEQSHPTGHYQYRVQLRSLLPLSGCKTMVVWEGFKH